MKLTCWALVSLVMAALIAFAGCSGFPSDPQLNTASTVQVELVSDRPTTVEGKYLLRFDTKSGYATLKMWEHDLLLKDWQVRAPEDLRVLERKAVVTKVDHKETIGQHKFLSRVYELQITVSLAAAPEAAALQSNYEVVASFPAAIVVRETFNAFTPHDIPEVRFHVKHFPRNSDRALDRFGDDFRLTAVFTLVAVVGYWLAEKHASIGVIFLLGVGWTVYYLYLTLRDLWWIISGM